MESDKLYELRKTNKKSLKAIKREKIFKSIFYLILALIVSIGLKDTDFKYPIVFLIIIFIIGIVINISQIIKLEEKDEMLNEFFLEDYLLFLNDYTLLIFQESKNELVNILIETSKYIDFLKRNVECTISLETELNRYRITYKIIPDGLKIENLYKIKRLWQSDINRNKAERDLYLKVINNLYRFRRKEYKSFKILKIQTI